jgi:hypothetical protein
MSHLTRRATMLTMGMALLKGAGAKGKGPPKEHKEFHAVNFDEGWQAVPGFPDGFDRKILAGHLDEASKKGSRTTLLRIKPGVYTTVPIVHAYWEEVYVLSGDFIVGNDKDGKGGERFTPNTYACRPPGIRHGPFKSEAGCITLEIHYYDRL